jgi:phenylalanyl-tRNA synthetase beta subunit
MKISVELLNSYLENQLTTERMAEVIERTEVEVEEILYANRLDEKIVVAKVLEVEKHPNADKLIKAKVDNGSAVVDIVCGAPNIREGLMVALAQVGSILPDGFEIGEAKIRGEISHGMLCSEKELAWGDDHNGIIELDPSLPIGQSLCDIAKMSDIIDIKTPSNRWDYLSYIGLGREIAASDDQNMLIEPETEEITYQNREVAKVNKSGGECKAFYTVKARVKANCTSPRWLVDNLQASGVRTINPVVDITNFVMLEYGQPSHAYDAQKIKGNIGVRLAKDNEKLTTLDGKTLKLTKSDLVIVDNSGAIGLAGVMGGASTETDKNTTEVLVEIANFDKTIVRRSALRHGIRTEASARFEKGLPTTLPSLATKRIIKLLKEICGAKILEANEQLYSPYSVLELGLRLRKAEKFIGYKLDEKQVMSAFSKRGFEPKHFSLTKELKNLENLNSIEEAVAKTLAVAGLRLDESTNDIQDLGMEVPGYGLKPADVLFKKTGNKLEIAGLYCGKKGVLAATANTQKLNYLPVTKITKSNEYAGAKRYVDNFNHIISVKVPWWRNDVSIQADLFEEIAKTQNYNQMPETLADIEPNSTQDHQLLPKLMDLREKMVALGLMEVMTYSFISKEDIDFIKSDIGKYLQIENPLNSEQDYLRTTLLPSHLRSASTNQSSDYNAMFELSRIYEKDSKGAIEDWSLGITVWGKDSMLRLKGIVDSIFGWYNQDLEVERDDKSDIYLAGRSAMLLDNYGNFGQVMPSILKKYDIKSELSFAQINVARLVGVEKKITALPLLPYQVIYKDITVELDNYILYSDVVKKLGDGLHSAKFIDEYANDDLKVESRKRLTIRIGLDLGPNPKNDEINKIIKKYENRLEAIEKSKVL